MDEIDAVGRRSADMLVAEVNRRIDVEEALRRVHDRSALDRSDMVIVLDPRRAAPRGRVLRATAAVAAVAVVVAGGIALSQRDHPRHLAPSATDVVSTTLPATVQTTTVAPSSSTTPSTVAPAVDEGVQQVVVIDQSTPILEGQVVASTGIASPQSWVGSVSPSGHIYVAMTVMGTTYAEVVDGQFVDTGVPAVDETGVLAPPEAGPADLAAEQTADWHFRLESTDYTLYDCGADDCPYDVFTVGDGYAWVPQLHSASDDFNVSNLVSLVRPDTAPITAWLDCGFECHIFDADDGFVYTLGYAEGGGAAVVIRRFAVDDIAAGRSAVPDAATDALADWPAPPQHTPALDDVPMMLPPSLTDGLRTEYADDPPSQATFTQSWLGEGPDAPVLTIDTNIGFGNARDGDVVSLSPWDRAVFPRMGEGYVSLQLAEPSGSVDIWSYGLTRDDLMAVALSLHAPIGDEGGWGVGRLPAGLMPAHEGWSTGAASRFVTWSDDTGAQYELWIVSGVPSTITSPLNGEPTVRPLDIGGTNAFSFELGDGLDAVVWSPLGDVVVRFAARNAPGGVDGLVTLARSITIVDRATWLSSTTEAPPDDGCNSMFC